MIVTFSDENQYFTIPHNTDEDRSRGMMYFRDLIKNCELAEKNIVDAINENCTNKIILMFDGYPLTVRDMSINWYEDDTVCKIWSHMESHPDFSANLYKLFDQEVNEHIKVWDVSDLQFMTSSVKFYFNKVMRLPKLYTIN